MGFSRANCPPSSATSVAIVIIPNLGGMFNENRTFLTKKLPKKALFFVHPEQSE
jgi:hypothetical protein